MLDGYSTNATVAKIHAVHGKMLTKENYHEMTGKRSVAELAEYLKKSPRFKEALADIDPNTIHRGFLEELLKKSNFDIYVRLCKFQRLDSTPFYNFLIQKIEVEQIIEAVNRINTHVVNDSIANVPMYARKRSKLDLLKLGAVDSEEQLREVLKGTPYDKLLSKLPVDENGGIDYGECERLLITFYYSRLIKYVEDNFLNKDVQQLKKIIFAEVDVINIVNAYRKKAFFGYNAQQIKAEEIPFTRIGKRRMNSLYEKETAEQMLEMLKKMSYGKDEFVSDEYIEIRFQTFLCSMMKHVVARSCSAPVVIYAFMKLCDIEVKNIIHIIEGIRYEVDPAYIEKNLIVF
ncbi:MAG: V0D/AC39 family V-type ATPase subunit [Oscillospiraceae bacterium]